MTSTWSLPYAAVPRPAQWVKGDGFYLQTRLLEEECTPEPTKVGNFAPISLSLRTFSPSPHRFVIESSLTATMVPQTLGVPTREALLK